MKRPAKHVLRNVAQLRAVATPVRHEIVTIMEELGEFSVGDLAGYLDRPPESVYYHVRALVQAGLVMEVGSRPGPTRPEKLYALVAERLSVDRENRAPAYRAVLKKSARSACRLSERLLQRAFDDRRCHLAGPNANFYLHQRSARLSRTKLRELARLLEQVDRYLLENDDPDQERAYVVTTSLAPVLKDESARQATSGGRSGSSSG